MSDDHNSYDHCRLVDTTRTIALPGTEGLDAAAVVDINGTTTYWVIDPDLLGTDCDLGNEEPAHERVGPLEDDLYEVVWSAPVRCSAPRADGQPCRRIVTPGNRCPDHSEVNR